MGKIDITKVGRSDLQSPNLGGSVGRSDPQPLNLGGNDFAFGRMNYILLAVCMLVVVVGFLLMSGSGSSVDAYNPDIYSARRIKVAPLVCLVGFLGMIVAVVYRPKSKEVEK